MCRMPANPAATNAIVPMVRPVLVVAGMRRARRKTGAGTGERVAGPLEHRPYKILSLGDGAGQSANGETSAFSAGSEGLLPSGPETNSSPAQCGGAKSTARRRMNAEHIEARTLHRPHTVPTLLVEDLPPAAPASFGTMGQVWLGVARRSKPCEASKRRTAAQTESLEVRA